MLSENTTVSACGVTMPRIIYGTAWKKERTAALVEKAITEGFRGIDTACQPKHYHEAGVGEGLKTCIERGLLSRNQLYLQTKFTPLDGQDPERIPYGPNASLAEQVAQSFQASLANLKTDYLDCLLLHSPLADKNALMHVWRAMETLSDSGKIRQLGLSNCYSLPELENLYGQAQVKPAVLQNRFYAATGYDAEIRAFCRQHRIIYQSFWTLTANPNILQHPTLGTLASKHRRTPAQVLFRYLTQTEIIPLTGTSNPEHMQDDLAIFQFSLSPDECAALSLLFTAH